MVTVMVCVAVLAPVPVLLHLGAAGSEGHMFWICHPPVQPAARRSLRRLLRQRLRCQRDVPARPEPAGVPPAGHWSQGRCFSRCSVCYCSKRLVPMSLLTQPGVRWIFGSQVLMCLLGCAFNLYLQTVTSELQRQENKYTVKPLKELKSNFVAQQEKKKQDAALPQKQKLNQVKFKAEFNRRNKTQKGLKGPVHTLYKDPPWVIWSHVDISSVHTSTCTSSDLLWSDHIHKQHCMVKQSNVLLNSTDSTTYFSHLKEDTAKWFITVSVLYVPAADFITLQISCLGRTFRRCLTAK